jgi:hypothetical protein
MKAVHILNPYFFSAGMKHDSLLLGQCLSWAGNYVEELREGSSIIPCCFGHYVKIIPFAGISNLMMWWVLSYEPESYASSSVAAGRISHAEQVKNYDPAKNGHPGPPGWGWGVGFTP